MSNAPQVLSRVFGWIVLLGACLLVTTMPRATESRDVAVVYDELMIALEGEPVPVVGSPALCQPDGRRARAQDDPKDWLFGRGDCQLTYPPKLTSLVTPLTEGGSRRFAEFSHIGSRVTDLLEELLETIPTSELPLDLKLWIHSTAWEIAFGLDRSLAHHPEWRSEVQPILDRAFRLLEATQFSEEEIEKLPNTLPDLPHSARAPELETTVRSLLEQSSRWVEILPPTDLHADLLLGRFNTRIFLTSKEPDERARLLTYLKESMWDYPELRNIPQRFGRVQAVLLMSFNVFDRRGRITPTPLVAFWLQYSFLRKTSYDLPFTESANAIDFLVIEYKRRQSTQRGPAFDYGKLDLSSMARTVFLNVKPTWSGADVITARAHCLRCHRFQVATFDTHSVREVDFGPPLARQGRETLTPFYSNFEKKLHQWQKERRSP